MIKKLPALNLKQLGIAGIILFLLAVITSPLKAQQSPENKQLKSLRSDVGIVGLTANLHWYNYYSIREDEMNANTELSLQFRNVRMVSSHLGVGYRVLGSISMVGLFERVSFGESGIGPMVRFYPFDSKRWQPYLQAGSMIGYELALGNVPPAANDNDGVRFRTSLQAGLSYRVSNAFGIFLEVGPAWDYDSAFSLDTRAIQVNVGIELFRFN